MNQHPIQPEALEFLGHKDSFYSVGAIVFFLRSFPKHAIAKINECLINSVD